MVRDILQDINFYKLVVAIFIPLAIFFTIFRLGKKKKKPKDHHGQKRDPTTG
jgi:hypothetical protein